MARRDVLVGLKATQLKLAAWLMGVPSAGTKAELDSVIRQSLSEPRTFGKRGRIVSIDMGIKNLGVCVLEAPHLANANNLTSPTTTKPLRIVEWKKINVLSHLLPPSNSSATPNPTPQEKNLSLPTTTPKKPSQLLPLSIFTPSHLSKTALHLATSLTTTHDPDQILIERQRFRSGGNSAVQEWTLRVNMLESMLWACFETLSNSSSNSRDASKFPARYEVLPARVAGFWCGSPFVDGGTRVPQGLFSGEGWEGKGAGEGRAKGKVEKKDKIAVVRSWISQGPGSGGGESSAVRLEFSEQAGAVAEVFVPGSGRAKKDMGERAGGKVARGGIGGGEKLDDLADCLLQGVAWVRWEENRRRILEMIEQES